MAAPVVKSLERMLDYCTQKQKVISRNIANIGTEDYQRQNLEFKQIFSDTMGSNLRVSDEKHFTSLNSSSADSEYQLTYDNSVEKISGINNVDIDQEMAEMAENTLKFKFAARKMSDYFKSIQNVIKGGGSAS